jgi:hypothetical protein
VSGKLSTWAVHLGACVAWLWGIGYSRETAALSGAGCGCVADITEQSLAAYGSVVTVGHSCVGSGVRIGDITEARYGLGGRKPHTLLSCVWVASALWWESRIGESLDELPAGRSGPMVGSEDVPSTESYWRAVSPRPWEPKMDHLQTGYERAVPVPSWGWKIGHLRTSYRRAAPPRP